MHRTFATSTTRRQRTLDGQWSFVTDPDDRGLTAEWYDSFPPDADRIAVPAAWNARTGYHDYEGVAWYRRRFDQPAATTAVLTFHGVCHDATVWLDGERVADHYGGYTPFSAVVDLDAGEHELVVRADSSRDERSVPKPGTDWFPYGGITREVVLAEVPGLFVEGLAAEYEFDGNRVALDATVTLHNRGDGVPIHPDDRDGGADDPDSEPADVRTADAGTADDGDEPATVELAVEPARDAPVPGTGSASVAESVAVPAGRATVAVDLSLAFDADRWSPDRPALYELVARVDGDERRERVGFREVAVTDADVLVNGDPVRFRGVNRHEDHPEWGHAQPARLQELDLDLVERAGFNAVRTSHYPNHPRFLDMCDERGVLVLEEIPYWQFDAERFDREGVLDRGRTALREMIDRDRHHPSVVAWSVTNECANEEAGVYDATATLVETAREADDRPVTLATNNFGAGRGGEDPALELVDFACLNDYPGWYTEGEWSDLVEHVRERYPNLPILVSEFGASAVAGERTRENQKWSEGYQADVVADAVEYFEAADPVVGFTVWQFCDTRTDPRGWSGRPKTKNNKGIVDEYRRPKDAYYRLADRFGDE
ncbi:MAG: glycoside hydrolase family 2 protein [Haloarculaceae archaeon]